MLNKKLCEKYLKKEYYVYALRYVLICFDVYSNVPCHVH